MGNMGGSSMRSLAYKGKKRFKTKPVKAIKQFVKKVLKKKR